MTKEALHSACPHCAGKKVLFNGQLACPCTEGLQGEELEVMVALARSLHAGSNPPDGPKGQEDREALFNFLSKKS